MTCGLVATARAQPAHSASAHSSRGRSIADTILEACEVRTLLHLFRQKGLKAYRKLYASSYSEREEEGGWLAGRLNLM